MSRIQVSPQAAAQIRVAASWWRANRPKAPLAFAEELEKGLDLVRVWPASGEAVRHPQIEARRILLGRIQYYLYYSISPDAETIEILALWHTSRGSTPKI